MGNSGAEPLIEAAGQLRSLSETVISESKLKTNKPSGIINENLACSNNRMLKLLETNNLTQHSLESCTC